MVKKIGNVVLLSYIFLFSLYCAAESIKVDLRILDEQGTVIKKTGVGIPTILEVIIRGTSAQVDKLYIDGLKGFEVQQCGTTKQLSTVNGVTSTKNVHRYMIRIHQEGTYSIGPVHVQIQNKSYSSSSSVLEVSRDYTPTRQDQEVELEVHADKQTVVVGEHVPISIRFYTAKECELLGIDPLELQHCKMGAMKGPFTGVIERNGMQQKYLEWRTALTPQKAGILTVPALKAHYKEPMSSAGLHTSLLGGLFDFGYTRKYIYSNAERIHVEPLPEFKGTVHAVGSFTSLQAKLNLHEAKQGEGVVLSLMLEGQGDLDGIAHPKLKLPDSLTYYDSKSTTAPSGTKKTFEYIIQGKKDGMWEIPFQEFVFFDVCDKTYKVLQTNVLSLTIIPRSQVQQETKSEKIESIKTSVQDVWPANENNQLPDSSRAKLPTFVFLLGLFLPIMACLVRGSCFIFHWYTARDSKALKMKQAFANAKKNIKAASKNHDTAQLYDIFIIFAADRYGIEPAQVSQEFIRQKLGRLSEATVSQWEIFFSKITEQAYANRFLTVQEKEELFKSALMWLTLFQKSETV